MIYRLLRFRAIIHEMCVILKSKHRRYLETAVQKQKFYVFYSMLFTSWTSKNFTELHYDDKGVIIFQCSLHLCQRSSATFEQAHVLPPGNSCSRSWSHWHSILQCLTTSIITSLQAFFQRTKQVTLWRCKVMTVQWMLQYCPSKICNILRGARTFVP